MKKLLLSFGLLLGLAVPALAQVPCVGVGGVNSVPQAGVTCAQPPAVASFAATGVGIAPASTATDIACLTGGAGVVVRVQSVRVNGSAGTLITLPVLLTKNAVADTGGTAATGTALPVPYKLDSTNNAAIATTIAYTANPTINDSTPGIISAAEISLNTTAALVGMGGVHFEWGLYPYTQAPILRGTAQQLCVNLNSTSPSSGLVNVTFRWTESPQ